MRGSAQGGDMIVVLQVAGVAAMLIGLATIGMGIPVKEFSFGNTMILSGTVGLCTGMLLLGMSVVALEVRMMARRLAGVRPDQDPRARPTLPPFPAAAGVPSDDGSPAIEAPSLAGVQPESAKAPPAPEPAQAPPPKPKRNLLFQSSMRRDRERPDARPAEGAPPIPSSDAAETPPANFEDAWPKPDRARGSELPPQRRTSRMSASPAEASAATGAPPPPQPEGQPAVTVLKSGVVDGMAY